MPWFRVLWFLIVTNPLCSTTPPKLNLPRVLLPIFRTASTNFTLEVTGGGCYKWYLSRSDLVHLKTVRLSDEFDCSTNASISVLTKDLSRNVAIVIAEDVFTQHVIRADVIVDVISTLNIVTTTRELYMEEPPELFEVRAYDDQGNEFTTLHGIEFQWLIHGAQREASPVLKFMTFRESPYETPSSIVEFDAKGRQGHIVLLEGVRTGSSKVSVRLPYPEYHHVQPTEVSLNVVANLILDPTEVYILKGDVVHFRLMQVSQGRFVTVDTTGHQYQLISENNSIASVQGFYVYGNDFGQVKISLQDLNNDDEDVVKLPTAQVTVDRPFYTTLKLVPYNNWVLVTLQYATIVAEIYNVNNHKFLLGPYVKMNITVIGDLFHTVTTTPNGTAIYGYGNKPGVGEVSATLFGVSVRKSDESVVSAKATLSVYPRLDLNPVALILPWHPIYSGKFRLKYNATGGDGNYIWSSENNSVANVTQSGILRITGLGETKIVVSMKQDQNVKANSLVNIIEPSHLELLHHVYDSEVGQPIFLHVILYGHLTRNGKVERFKFSQCDHLLFNVETTEQFFYNDILKEAPIGGACQALAVIGKEPGVSKVTVKYKGLSSTLSAITVVAAFKPLTSIFPEPGSPLVLAVGSSSQMVFRFGPQPGHTRQLRLYVKTEENVRYENIKVKQDLYVYNVVCIDLGETDFSLHVSSKPLDPMSKTAEAVCTVKVICSLPHILKLEADYPENCPVKTYDFGFTNMYNKLRLHVVIKDENGNPFSNATSLKFQWNVEKSDMAFIDMDDTVQLMESEEPDYSLPMKHYKYVTTKNKTGVSTISGKIIGYRKSVLNKLNIFAELELENDYSKSLLLGNTISLKIVDKIVIEPNSVALFNHPNIKAHIVVSNGSGHYAYEVSPKNIASYEQDGSRIAIVPKLEGQGLLMVRDVCVLGAPVSVNVKVLRLNKIKIEAPAKVEKGKKFSATVSLFDKDDQPLHFPNIAKDELKLSLKSASHDIIQVISEEMAFTDSSKIAVKFKLKGLSLGETSLIAKCLDVSSDNFMVQVFQPVNISPRSLTLTVGSEIQVSVLGGPSSSNGIQFAVSDTYIISVSSVGVVKGLHIGRTTLKAQAIGLLGQIFSQDNIEVNVIPLTGVRIVAPVSTLLVGNVMPLWASGIPNQLNSFILGAVSPSLNFKWGVSLPSVAQLKDALQSTNIKVTNEDRLTMRLKALKTGRTQIFLSVSGKNQDGNYFTHNCSLEIKVINRLQWVHPQVDQAPTVLIAPNSEFQVNTNMEMDNALQYKIINVLSQHGWKPTFSHINSFQNEKDVITIDQTGLVKSSSVFGSAIVLARIHDEVSTQQSILLNVMVKQVYFIMINIFSKLRVSETILNTLPHGLHLDINVTYHDQFGSVFHTAPVQIEVKPNIAERINYRLESSNIFTVSLEKPGRSTLRIAETATTTMEDFLKLPVSNHITPQKSYISLEEIVCFSLPSGTSKGIWKSENDVINIDTNGIAYAAKVGVTIITYNLDEPNSKISSYLSVEVLPVETVQFGTPSSKTVTNSFVGTKYIIPVLLVNEKTQKESTEFQPSKCLDSTLLKKDPPFQCEIRFNTVLTWIPIENVLSVRSIFDLDIGSYACEMTVLNGPSYNTSLINANVTLRVNFPFATSDSLILNFQAGFHLMNKRLYFSVNHRTSHLTISGTQDVLKQIILEPSDSMLFSVLGPIIYKDRYTYPVRIDLYHWSQHSKQNDYFLTLYSRLTQQNIRIPLIIDDSGLEDTSYHLTHEPKSDVWGSFSYWVGPSFLSIDNFFKLCVYSVILLFSLIGFIFIQRSDYNDSSEFTFSPDRRRRRPYTSTPPSSSNFNKIRHLSDSNYIRSPKEY